jgi:hypothetical protein
MYFFNLSDQDRKAVDIPNIEYVIFPTTIKPISFFIDNIVSSGKFVGIPKLSHYIYYNFVINIWTNI